MKDEGIRNTGRRVEGIVNIGPRQPRVDPEFVAKALGAELVPPGENPFRRPRSTCAKCWGSGKQMSGKQGVLISCGDCKGTGVADCSSKGCRQTK